MPARERTSVDKAVAVVEQGDAPIPSSKIPPALRFPLVTLLSLVISSLLYSFTASFVANDLASVSRSLDQWWEVGALVGFRAFELGLGWFGNYDSYDLAALSLLSHGPPLFLLWSFYEVRTSTVIFSLVIDSLATYIPFRLMRPLSRAHATSSFFRSSPVVPNDYIVTDPIVQALTTFLAASIYSVVLYTSYVTFLPISLVTYFDNIPTIEAAHSSTYISLLPLTLFLGLAAKSFIFTPSAASAPSTGDAKNSAFNPVTATLTESFLWNILGYSSRAKVVIKRTLLLMLVSGLNTFVQTAITIEGVETRGAVAYSLVWVVAAAITGMALGLTSAV